MRQVVLDTETTGLSPKEGHKIIEIGCVEMKNRRLTGNNLHFYINPQREIEEGAQAVHGITSHFLEDKPIFQDVEKELLEFLRGSELIIHNAPFDLAFLNSEYKSINPKFPLITHYCTVVDTLVLARQKHPGQQNSLDALCRRYHVDNSNRDLHGALLDSELLAQVYLFMTGGQEQLFSEEKNKSSQKNQTTSTGQKTRPPELTLNVVKANSEELGLHEEFIKKLEERGRG